MLDRDKNLNLISILIIDLLDSLWILKGEVIFQYFWELMGKCVTQGGYQREKVNPGHSQGCN